MSTKTHQVLQQTTLLNLRPAVADAHTAPIGLTGHQAIAFEQVAGQGFGDRVFMVSTAQQVGCRLITVAINVQPVQAEPVQFMDGLALKLFRQDKHHTHPRMHGPAKPHGMAQISRHTIAHSVGICKSGVVKTIQVELE